MLHNIPDEMKQYDQWIVWRYEDIGKSKPSKMPYSPRFNGKASVTEPDTWGSFAQALEALNSGMYSGLGFILSDRDPFGFIDLDDAWQKHEDGSFIHPDPQEVHDRQVKIFNTFNSYAEKSPSGNGLHIIVRSPDLPTGRKRSSVEVYTNKRFMTMTGDVYRNEPVNEYGELLKILYDELGGPATIHMVGHDVKQTETDEQIYEKASGALNGEKFVDLYEGRWPDYYTSQSEADFAIIDIIAYYTQNRLQIERIFHASALGKRDKAKRNDYVQHMINRAFDRLLPPVDIDGLLGKLREMQETKGKGTAEGQTAPANAALQQTAQPANQPVPAKAQDVNADDIVFPPGLVGRIAEFIYAAAPRPVRQIALASSIAFMAGICGRGYNVSAAGLNHYVMLLAPTGTGKEAVNNGISKLVTAIKGTGEGGLPGIANFVGPGEIRSDAALLKWCAKTPCFLSVVGEVGLRIKTMSAPNASPSESGLRRVLLDLYNKSGEGNILNPMAYSDKDKNTEAVVAPAFSMIGESTPERFYEALDETMVSEGLLPRFLTIEYKGNRPPRSDSHASVQPDSVLVADLRKLVAHCMHLMSPGQKAVDVPYTKEARAMLNEFDRFCDAQINSGNGETMRHMWNRGHLKALRLAALVAVGIYPASPVIDEDCAKWAIDVVVRDIENILKRFADGEVGMGAFGNNEGKQYRDIIGFIKKYYELGPKMADKRYGVPRQVYEDGVITYSAISRACLQLASFRNAKMTSSAALKIIIQNMIDSDEIREIPRSQMQKTYNTTQRAFALSNASILQR